MLARRNQSVSAIKYRAYINKKKQIYFVTIQSILKIIELLQLQTTHFIFSRNMPNIRMLAMA